VIRVLLADDQTLVRAGFRFIAGSAPDIEVVGEAADGASAVDLARSLRPEVVLMDIRMPGTDGLEATRQIASSPELSGVRVIILTTFEADEYVFEAIRAGASGFLVKDTEPEDLISAIRVVARGDALLSPSVTRTLISSIAGRGPSQPLNASVLSVLTDREREVLARVAAGMSNDQIAAALFMSPLTAKTHVNRMMAKLGARDRAQLVVIAYETGLVRPGLSLRQHPSPNHRRRNVLGDPCGIAGGDQAGTESSRPVSPSTPASPTILLACSPRHSPRRNDLSPRKSWKSTRGSSKIGRCRYP